MISHSEVLARVEAASDALPLLTIALAAEPGVDWVRVQLHDDTHEVDEIAAEAIAICTDREPDDIEELLDSEDLQADGVIEGYAISDPGDEPAVPAGSRVLSPVWD
ncbi:hypothetical protein AB0L13_17265 [Saccharopolyspora shandongensis]|uniref:hypothetical protein n=1 Tax=Saccharopolyspora shandongensis TaxID=418495 RepID=UPI0034403305